MAGIPGLDESYLPRWIGLGFGALVLLNHLLSPSPTPAQLVGSPRTFILLYSTGAGAAGRVPLPEGSRQVFVIPDDLSAAQKEDMAWATYVLLQNTNTTSVLDINKCFGSLSGRMAQIDDRQYLHPLLLKAEAWFELDQDGSCQTFP
ncbi:hypothetical protein ACQ4PT_032313 [Festuca glaucescens]